MRRMLIDSAVKTDFEVEENAAGRKRGREPAAPFSSSHVVSLLGALERLRD